LSARVLGATGASGYVGQSLASVARTDGWTLVAIGRRPAHGYDAFRHADLGEALPPGLLDGLDAVIHLAANTTGASLPPDAEREFALALATDCHRRGVRLVYVSSQAAAHDAPSSYGRTKAAIEDVVRALGAIVVRPGQVVGGDCLGLFGALVRLVDATPVLPKLVPAASVQPIHVDDLSRGLLAALGTTDVAGRTLCLAGEPVDFDELLMKIAHHRLRCRRVRIPVPVALLRTALSLAKPVLGPAVSPERLDSLTLLPAMAASSDLQRLGVVLRPLASALDRRGSLNSVLLHEASTLARAFTGRAPSPRLCRRYARLLCQLDLKSPLDLPASVMMSPTALASLDSPALRKDAPGGFGLRMEAIVRLCEADPAMAQLFIMRAPRSGLVHAALAFLQAGFSELRTRTAAVWVRRALRHRR